MQSLTGVVILHPRMVPIDDYAEKPDMDINEVEITEDPEKIKEIARSMLNRTTGSIRTRSLVYFKNTISGRENYQVCRTLDCRLSKQG